MTTGLTYSQYVTQIATMAVVAENDPAFVTILPQMITYAENRMYRDIDFMFTSTSLHGLSFVLSPGDRNLSFNINLASNSDAQAGTFVVSEQINLLTGPSELVVTGASGTGSAATLTYSDAYTFSVGQTIVVSGMVPLGYNGTYAVTSSTYGSVTYASTTTDSMTVAGKIDGSMNASTSTNPDTSNRVPLLPTTKEFLDAVYGSSFVANRGQPQYFVPFNETLFFVGPVPDQAYPVEVVGTYRPNSLSATNTSTFISLYLPDVFIMASMIYISAYQRNFGRANDDPQMAVTYESQYQALLKSAMVEEARKKFEAAGWSSQSPSPVATPTRG
jgi:hypothetical protein